MHELSIAMSLVSELGRIAGEHGGAVVSRVRLRVGTLSGVDPEALRMAFPFAAANTPAAAAALDINIVRATVRCRSCGEQSMPEEPFAPCGGCGSDETEIVDGRDLVIESAELETAAASPDAKPAAHGRS
ncbi:MAG: hydrogenase maturation nickel metallochaperone HypA [Lentisphaerae bacterium]|nr:hydrogenase maturation nickel metallochaperone HypA [Lentisphaerota bacterium]